MNYKKTLPWFICFLLAASMLAGCGGSKTNEPAAVVETEEQPVENTTLTLAEMEAILSKGELSELLGATVDPADPDIQETAVAQNFRCSLNSQEQIVSITTTNPALCIYDLSPQLFYDYILAEMLRDQWSYVTEYFWYSESTDSEGETIVNIYQSAVFEKEHFELVLTTNTENNYGEICAMELIDVDLYEGSIDSANETVFAHLHELLPEEER